MHPQDAALSFAGHKLLKCGAKLEDIGTKELIHNLVRVRIKTHQPTVDVVFLGSLEQVIKDVRFRVSHPPLRVVLVESLVIGGETRSQLIFKLTNECLCILQSVNTYRRIQTVKVVYIWTGGNAIRAKRRLFFL